MWSACMLSQLQNDMHWQCPAGSLPAVYSALRNLKSLFVGGNRLEGMLKILHLSAAVM